MTRPQIALVSAPSTDATVLYTFNVADDRASTAGSGFTLGAPQWEGEPGVTGGSDDYRTIQLTHWIYPRRGDDASSVRTALDTLGRLLLADKTWLLIRQRPTSTPVWARVWRSTPAEMGFDDLQIGDTEVAGRYALNLTLKADPYLVGAQVQLANGVTVSFDPANGTNPCQYVLPAVVGDAPAPLVAAFDWPNARHGYRQFLGTSTVAPTFFQLGTGDGMTVDADTSVASNAIYSGGSARSTSFATVATMLDRMTGNGPALAPGRYKVFALCRRSSTGTQFAIRFGQKVTLAYAYQRTVQAAWVVGGTDPDHHRAWVEVAPLVDIPQGTGVDLSPETITVTPDIAIGLQRTAGSGAVQVDCLAFIPVRDSLFVSHEEIGPGGSSLFREYHDAELEALYVRAGLTGALVPALAAVVEGGYPTVVPGAGNVLTLLSQTHPTRVFSLYQNAPNVISQTATLRAWYRPLWLWPRP